VNLLLRPPLAEVWRCTDQLGREPRQLLSAHFNRVGFLLSAPKNSAHNLIKLHIENELVRIFAGWSESCFIDATREKRPATHNCALDLD
jgi:hypothetical protein